MSTASTSNHPTLSRMRHVATKLGSTATTPCGILRAIRGADRDRAYIRASVVPSHPLPRWQWLAQVSERRKDAQHKEFIGRCRDSRYRGAQVRRLRTELATLSPLDRVAEMERGSDRIRRLTALDRLPTLTYHTIPISDELAAQTHTISRRGKDTTVSPGYQYAHVHIPGSTQWKGGRPRRYTRAINDYTVVSYGVIVGSSLHYRLGGTDIVVEAPAGYHWDRDRHGIRLVWDMDDECDHHPTGSELRDGIDVVVARLLAQRDARRQAARAARLQHDPQLTVCWSDARRAGNCAVGINEWLSQHGLSSDRHYTTAEILSIATTEYDRARATAAIATAAKRAAMEEELGYCDLVYHSDRS